MRLTHGRFRPGVLIVLLLALALVAAACTSDADETTTTTAATGGETTTTAAGGEETTTTAAEAGGACGSEGVFVHAADDEPTTLDPAAVEPGEGGETVILQVYERLLEIGEVGPDPVPGLATEVPTVENGLISADLLTYTFPIREGVTFHDGNALTANDVKFSWDRAMEMDLPEGNAGILNDNIAETTVVDDATFEVVLQQPNAAFLNAVVPAMVSSVVSQAAVEANGGVAAGEEAPGSDRVRKAGTVRAPGTVLALFEEHRHPAKDARLGAETRVRSRHPAPPRSSVTWRTTTEPDTERSPPRARIPPSPSA